MLNNIKVIKLLRIKDLIAISRLHINLKNNKTLLYSNRTITSKHPYFEVKQSMSTLA